MERISVRLVVGCGGEHLGEDSLLSEYLSVKCWHCQNHQKVRVGETSNGHVFFTSACGYGQAFGMKDCALFVERETVEESNE